MTLGWTAAKSDKRIPDSCGVHATVSKVVGGLNLKDVVRHLSERDASLRRMDASHGVPMEASTNCSSEKLAIAIAQRQ